MDWTPEQRKMIDSYKKIEDVPPEQRRYKCHRCHHIVESSPCPACGETLMTVMCPLDHVQCIHDMTPGIEYCPICGEAICPRCGCHDVVQISRVTGYLQDVSGWNAGKQQELKDRVRYTLV